MFLVPLAACFLLTRCGYDPHDNAVLDRKISPDGKLEALIVQFHGGGPAVGVSNNVYIHSNGSPLDLIDRVFSSECTRRLAIDWLGKRSLRISYEIGPHGIDSAGSAAGPWWSTNRPTVSLKLLRRIRKGVCSG